ncbi:MAG TPA: sugar ABC transporter permease [Rhizobium sp.]
MAINDSTVPQRGEISQGVFALILVAPAVILLAGLIGYPLLQALYLSLTNTNTISLRGQFVGLVNFELIFASADFWTSFGNTLVWTISTVIFQIIFGVLFAVMLNERFAFRSLATGLILFPYVLSTVVVVLVWQWILNDLYGVANWLIVSSGLSDVPVNWTGTMPNAMITTVMIGTWKSFPFTVIIVLARLQTIAPELYSAARLDGASAIGRFFDITLPNLKGVLLLAVLLRSIWDIKEFDLIFILTGGGPQIGTQTLPLLVYKEAFGMMNLGRAAAVAVVMFGCISLLILTYVYVSRQGRQEGAAR